MKKFELITGVLAFISIIYRFQIGKELNLLIILSLLLLGGFYTYLSFAYFNNIGLGKISKKESYIGISRLRIFGTVGFGITLGITIIGILFMIMTWPGGIYNLTIGVVILGIISIVSLFRYLRTKSEFYLKLFKRIAIIGGIGLSLILITQNDLAEILDTERLDEESLEQIQVD